MALLAWASVIIFLAVAVYKIVKIARAPLGVRWEVYPVPHEEGAKRHYGGSYMEGVGWAKTHKKGSLVASLAPELMEIGAEVLVLKRVREHNRFGIWPLSMAMHWGIYLTVAWVGLIVLEVIVGNLTGLTLFGQIAVVWGPIAFALGAIGALALIIKRASNPELSLYTAPLDYANLVFLFAIFAAGLFGVIADPKFTNHARQYVQGALTFNPVSVPLAALLVFLLLELFFIYMPFSKLIHYIAKYFTFHQALWDDSFKANGDATDQVVTRQLAYKVGWAGPHIVQGKTWLEEVQLTGFETTPGQEAAKK